MPNERAWRAEAETQTSLKANVDDAALVLRLGLAVTAIRAAHMLTVKVGDGTTPHERGLHLWSFVLAVAYIHEAKVTASPRFPRVKELALKAGATKDLAADIGQLFSGKSRLGQLAERVRNSTVFHFDEQFVRKWIAEQNAQHVVWAEGLGPRVGKQLYRASLDTVTGNLLSGTDDPADLQKLIAEVLPATEKLLAFLEHAIAGYLDSVGAELIEE